MLGAMASTPEKVLLTCTPGYWTDGTLHVKVRSLSEPDREVPIMTRFVATPDVLEFEPLEDEHEVRARVTVKSGVEFPANDTVHVKVIADPATEMAMAALQAGAMLPPGVSIPKPFKNMTADVTVLVFPYQVEYTAVMPDGNQLEIAQGGHLSLAQDGVSSVVVKARVYRLNSSFNRLSESPVAGVTGSLSEAPALAGFSLTPTTSGEGFALSLASTEIKVGGEAPSAAPLAFKLSMPSGRRFTQRLSLQPQPLKASMSIQPDTLPVSLVRSLEGGKATLQMTLETAEGRGVPIAWKLDCPLGTCTPASGTFDSSGRAESTYHPPSPEEAGQAGTAWPRPVLIKALVGAQGVEAAQCQLSLTYALTVSLQVEKAGFSLLKQEVQVAAMGPCSARIVTRVGEKVIPVAFARVSGQGFPDTTSDEEGHCTLGLGQGNPQSLGDLTVSVASEVSLGQKNAHGLYQELAQRGFPADLKSRFDQFVDLTYVERLASQPESEAEPTQKVFQQMLSVVKVAKMSQGCLERNFERYRGYVHAFFTNIFAAFWDIWLGDKVTQVAGRILKATGRLVQYLAGPLTRSRFGRWALGGVHSMGQSLLSWAQARVTSIINRINSPNTNAKIREQLRERVHFNAVEGPVPSPQGGIVKALSASADDAVHAVEAQVAQAQANLQASLSRLTERVGQKPALPGPEWQANLKALQQAVDQAEEGVKQAQQALTKAFDQRDAIVATGGKLEAILGFVPKLLNLCYNLLSALLLAIVSAFILAMGSIIQGGDASQVLIKNLASRFMDLLGDKLSPKAGQAMSPDAVLNSLKAHLVHDNLRLSAFAVEEGILRASQWQPVDKENFERAVRYYYNSVERGTLESESDEIWMEFYGTMADWLEWLVIWFSRIGALMTAIIGTIASAGLAAPEVWAFDLAVNEALELFHKVYGVIKVSVTGKMMAFNMGIVVRVVVPSQIRYINILYGDTLDDRAVAYLGQGGAS